MRDNEDTFEAAIRMLAILLELPAEQRARALQTVELGLTEAGVDEHHVESLRRAGLLN